MYQDILKQRTTDIRMKPYCANLLKSFGSLKYTKDVLEELNKKIRLEVERLGGNPHFLTTLGYCESVIP